MGQDKRNNHHEKMLNQEKTEVRISHRRAHIRKGRFCDGAEDNIKQKAQQNLHIKADRKTKTQFIIYIFPFLLARPANKGYDDGNNPKNKNKPTENIMGAKTNEYIFLLLNHCLIFLFDKRSITLSNQVSSDCK